MSRRLSPLAPLLGWGFEFFPFAVLAACMCIKVIRISLDIGDGLDWSSDRADRLVVSASLGSVMVLLAPLMWLPRRRRFAAVLMVDLAVTGLALADSLYVRFYGDLPSYPDLSGIGQIGLWWSSLPSLARPADAVHALDLIVGLAVLPFYAAADRRVPAVRRRVSGAVGVGLLATGILVSGPAIRVVWGGGWDTLANPTLRREVGAALGLLPFHVYDAVAHVFGPTPAGSTVGAEDLRRIRRLLGDLSPKGESPSPLFGIARGRNVIVISAESLQAFPIGLEIHGRPVAPHLTAFAGESLRFPNFYDQTHHGTTSDAEFMVLQSLHPLPAGYIPHRYRFTRFRALPAILSEHGYATVSTCGAPGNNWNMSEMHPRLGFDESFFDDHYAVRDRLGPWMSDLDFFQQVLPRLEGQRRPFLAFLLTSSNHHPYRLPAALRALDVGGLEGSLLGDYLQSVHYFDMAFGRFVEGLRTRGLLDDSVVVMYGDHQGFLRDPPALAPLLGFPGGSRLDHWRTRKRVPLLIRLPHGAHAGVREDAAGHLDVAPTILALVGARVDDAVMLGRDLTRRGSGLVVFRDGSFAVDTRHYVNRRGSGGRRACYDGATGREIECGPLADRHREARERLHVSDLIIRGGLIPTLTRAPLPTFLSELSPPAPRSRAFGLQHVKVDAANVHAHPPSGATFTLPPDGRSRRLVFTPSFAETAPRDKTDGVTFEVWLGDARIYERHVLGTERPGPVVLDLPGSEGQREIALSLVTTPGPRGNPDYDWAVWRNVRVVPVR